MSNLKYGPKIIPLGEGETLASIERWKQNVVYHLRLNEEFRPFLYTDFGKKSKANPSRALKDFLEVKTVRNKDGEEKQESIVTQTKEDQCFTVDLLQFKMFGKRSDFITIWRKVEH